MIRLKQEGVISHRFFTLGMTACSAIASVHAAAADSYHITAAEKAACVADASRLCMSAYPDEDKLLSCMAANRSSLTRACVVAFDAGLKRRHLVVR